MRATSCNGRCEVPACTAGLESALCRCECFSWFFQSSGDAGHDHRPIRTPAIQPDRMNVSAIVAPNLRVPETAAFLGDT